MKATNIVHKPHLDSEGLRFLINALQLCIKTPIAGFFASGTDILHLKFSTAPHDDKGFEYFQKLVTGKWNEKELSFEVKNLKELLSSPLLNFLMLSRLQKENMRTLARIDAQYRPLAKKIIDDYQDKPDERIQDIKQASQVVFSHVAQQKMTLRELAAKSDLTQAALSNFKAGNDIRLSSLVKILKALGLNLMIGE